MNYFKDNQVQIIINKNTVKTGEKINVYLYISNDLGFVDEAKIIMNKKNAESKKEFIMKYCSTENNVSCFTSEIVFNNIGIHYFCIKLIINGYETYIKNDVINKKAIITNKDYPYWSITVYDKDFVVPEWAKEKVMYHIFVDRFYKSEQHCPKLQKNRIS